MMSAPYASPGYGGALRTQPFAPVAAPMAQRLPTYSAAQYAQPVAPVAAPMAQQLPTYSAAQYAQPAAPVAAPMAAPTYTAAEYAAMHAPVVQGTALPVAVSVPAVQEVVKAPASVSAPDASLPEIGSRVVSLVDQPKWSPVPLKKGDKGVVVGHTNGKCSIKFDGVAGMLPLTAIQLVQDGSLKSTGGDPEGDDSEPVSIRFPGAPWPPPANFKEELLSKLKGLGVPTDALSVDLQQGSIVAVISGPADAMQALKEAPTDSMEVCGYPAQAAGSKPGSKQGSVNTPAPQNSKPGSVVPDSKAGSTNAPAPQGSKQRSTKASAPQGSTPGSTNAPAAQGSQSGSKQGSVNTPAPQNSKPGSVAPGSKEGSTNAPGAQGSKPGSVAPGSKEGSANAPGAQGSKPVGKDGSIKSTSPHGSTLSAPAIGVGEPVAVPDGTGTVVGYDKSATPYLVKLKNGLVCWYPEDAVQPKAASQAGSKTGSVVGSITRSAGGSQAGGSLARSQAVGNPFESRNFVVGSLVPSTRNSSKAGSLVQAPQGSGIGEPVLAAGVPGTIVAYDASSTSKLLVKTTDGLLSWYPADQVTNEAGDPLTAAGSVKAGMTSSIVGAVAEEVHAIHDKVSGFFGMIGGLFHSKAGNDKGPGGAKIGKGSHVEVTREDGSQARGHIVEDGGVNHTVQLHTDPPGTTINVAAASVAHTKTYAPDVGAGVEVLYQGNWFAGYVVGLPTAGQSPPLYQVMCHSDNPDELTLADAQSIRPLLSPEEKEVVDGEMGAIRATKEKEAAKQKKAKEAAQKRIDFKEKLDEIGLGDFYPSFVENGYDAEDSLDFVPDSELTSFGMKAGHISKLHAAFPKGNNFVVSNACLQSLAPGIVYYWTKDLSDDTHKVAEFGSVVRGTELPGGWLKVGKLYLPTMMEGKKVLFPQGSEPKDAPEAQTGSATAPATESKPTGVVGRAMGAVAAVENKAMGAKTAVENKAHAAVDAVKGGVAAVESKFASSLDSFAHMLHF